MSVFQKHPYHLVDPSPWPLLGSLGALASSIGGVMYMHSFEEGGTLLSLVTNLKFQHKPDKIYHLSKILV